jgi:CheY-like chemotaxis protein
VDKQKGAGMPKILVADDSIAVRKVAERLLTEAGLGVTLAANGEEALAVLSKDRPDVIVSDVIMPDKSGYEICTFVRGHAMLAATPVLLISGIVNDEVTKQAEACRADGILKKPFQGTALKDRVLELLAKREAQPPEPGAGFKLTQPVAASPMADKGPQIADSGQGADRQTAVKLREVEEHLHAERARSEQLAKRLADLEGVAGRVKDLEAALKAEQDAASNRISELEAALQAERAAAAQLVQQVTDLERAAARLTELQQKIQAAEAALASERARAAALSDKAAAAEAAEQRKGELDVLLAAEKQKRVEAERRCNELGTAITKVQELEVLLATERERNGLLARRVAEAELATQSATKRFEDMARKLGEIAGLASQLGNGKGQS